jgi:hypothetical protein
VEKAIERAQNLDTSKLFEEAHDHISSGRERQNAVAGVAAVALRFGRGLPPPHIEWAENVCLRAWKTPEVPDRYFSSGSVLLDHPVLYADRGLAAIVRYKPQRRDALEALIRLAAHPYEQVVSESLGALLALWDQRPDVAWLGLGLAVSLSIIDQPPFDANPELQEEQRQRHVHASVEAALIRSHVLEEPPQALPSMPPAWVKASGRRRIRRRPREEASEIEWEHPIADVDCHLLGKLLDSIPVTAAMEEGARRDLLLSWCDGLVEWTVQRLCPSWSRKPGQEPHEVERTELYEWRRELYRFLARLSLHLEPEESARRFVEPAAATDDETFGSLVESYVSLLTCNVMDEPVLPSVPLALLQLVVPRLLSHGQWERSKWNDGALYDAELSQIVQAMFFVQVDKALGAARFANGNWSDVSCVLPLIEPILEAQGQNPTVTRAFLTLCERAFECYPEERFVAQLPMILGRKEGMPLGWRGTSLPARLAALIQRFSERKLPLPMEIARTLLRALDALVDMGDRRAAAIQTSEVFKDVRTTAT